MARNLAVQDGVDVPDSDFPNGRARDDDGTGIYGTPANEVILGDALQFFMKLMRQTGLPFNALPDSEYSGLQLYEAFTLLTAPTEWQNLTLSASFTNFGDPYFDVQFRVNNVNRTIEFRGVALVALVLSTDTLVATLPVNVTVSPAGGGSVQYLARPLWTVHTQILALETPGFASPVNDFITITSRDDAGAGNIVLQNPGAVSVGDIYCFDGMIFSLD